MRSFSSAQRLLNIDEGIYRKMVVESITREIQVVVDEFLYKPISANLSLIQIGTFAEFSRIHKYFDRGETACTLHYCSGTGNAYSDFDSFFESTVGMTVEQSILLYNRQTNQSLTQEQVRRLFNDPIYARDTLMADKNLHETYREILNSNIPATEEEAIARGFKKMHPILSIYHNTLTDPMANSKYVGPNGHLEVVFDRSGSRVENADHAGTFNFFGPDDTSGHIDADIIPYKYSKFKAASAQ